MAWSDAEMGFTEAEAAEENDLGLIFAELATKQVLDLQAIN